MRRATVSGASPSTATRRCARRYRGTRRAASSRQRAASGRPSPAPRRRAASASDTSRNTTRAVARSRAALAGSQNAPPPRSATTPAGSAATARRSSARKAGSPSSAKIAATGFPAARAIFASSVTTGRPRRRPRWRATVDFPDPIIPASATVSADPSAIGLQRPLDVDDRVPAELLEERVGELPGDHRLADDRGGGHGAHVAPLVARLRRLARREVDGGQRREHRRDRLHVATDADRHAVRHPALEAARAVGGAVEALLLRPVDRVVELLARAADLRAVADRGGPDRLDPAERAGEPRVEAAVRVNVASEADGEAGRVDVEGAADGAAPGLLRVDEGAPLGRDRLVVHVQVGRLDRHELRVGRGGVGEPRARADRDHPRGDPHAEAGEELLRERAERDRDGGGARARALEHVAGVVEAVLERAGEVGVAGADLGELPAAARVRGDEVLPVLVVLVPDDERDRRAEGHAAAQAREELRLVLLDLLACAAPVPLLAAGEVGVHLGEVHRQPGGEPLRDRGEGGAVRLPGGEVAQRHEDLPGARATAAAMTASGAGRPVQRVKASAPWRTRSSSPVTTRAPAARAARTKAVSP